MPFKKWVLPEKEKQPGEIAALAESCRISPLAASVLAARGRADDAKRFLSVEGELSSPLALLDMDKAAKRVQKALDSLEKITVYGDYDCDGVTATALLYSYLTSAGAEADYYIPERDGEGYGLNREAVKKIAGSGTKLIITVDNGISALAEAEYVYELGMELVITDHHQPGEELPRAEAVVDPHRKEDKSGCEMLCGAGLALKLVAALEGDCEAALEYFADLAAIGTIGDVVPLVGENRILAAAGLRALKITDNLGLRALMAVSAVKPEALTAQTVSFSLAPRINAAGRMGSAKLAVQLLLSESPKEAESLAQELDSLNRKRQEIESEILSSVEEMLAQDERLGEGRLLILKSAQWHHGVIGIVCTRLVERYGKPALLLCDEGDGTLRGSGRSLGDFHLFQALSANASHLMQYGGHKLAAGFTVAAEEFDAFREGMEAYARENFDLMPSVSLAVDKVLEEQDLTVEAVSSLTALEPFGAENEAPLFLIAGATLLGATPLSGGKHQRLSLRMKLSNITALCFGLSTEKFFYSKGTVLDLVVSAGLSAYNGQVSVTFRVRDMRPVCFPQEKFLNARGYYEKLRRGEPVSRAIAARALPEKEDIATIYRCIKVSNGFPAGPDGLFALLFPAGINYCRLRIAIDMLREAELIAFTPCRSEIRLLTPKGKADLSATPTRLWLRERYGV